MFSPPITRAKVRGRSSVRSAQSQDASPLTMFSPPITRAGSGKVRGRSGHSQITSPIPILSPPITRATRGDCSSELQVFTPITKPPPTTRGRGRGGSRPGELLLVSPKITTPPPTTRARRSTRSSSTSSDNISLTSEQSHWGTQHSDPVYKSPPSIWEQLPKGPISFRPPKATSSDGPASKKSKRGKK